MVLRMVFIAGWSVKSVGKGDALHQGVCVGRSCCSTVCRFAGVRVRASPYGDTASARNASDAGDGLNPDDIINEGR